MLNWYFNQWSAFGTAIALLYQQAVSQLMTEFPDGNYP